MATPDISAPHSLPTTAASVSPPSSVVASIPTPLCENDDGNPVAFQCDKCGLLCHECEASDHQKGKFKTHLRVPWTPDLMTMGGCFSASHVPTQSTPLTASSSSVSASATSLLHASDADLPKAAPISSQPQAHGAISISTVGPLTHNPLFTTSMAAEEVGCNQTTATGTGTHIELTETLNSDPAGQVGSTNALTVEVESELRERTVVKVKTQTAKVMGAMGGLHERCDECQEHLAYVVCFQCSDRNLCRACNDVLHPPDKSQNRFHVRRAYVTKVDVDLSSVTVDSDSKKAKKGTFSQLLKLSTRHAVFDNALMRQWHAMGCWARFKFRVASFFMQLFSGKRNALPFWGKAIYEIEAKRGTSVSTYFEFVKWMYYLNLVLAILAAFLVAPSIFYDGFVNIAATKQHLLGSLHLVPRHPLTHPLLSVFPFYSTALHSSYIA
jgi:hypothetical protein